MTRPVVWSLNASDCRGAVGLQADQRALDALRVHACPVAASVVSSGPRPRAVAPDLLEAQLALLRPDMSPAAVKAANLVSAENARQVARWVRRLRDSAALPVVLDTVGCHAAGPSPADAALRRVLREELLPLATVCCASRAEAAWLLGGEGGLSSDSSLLDAMPALASLGPCSWWLTDTEGGRDLLISPSFSGWLAASAASGPAPLGLGCTRSAGLTGALAHGFAVADAVVLAKMLVGQAWDGAEAAAGGALTVRAEAGFAGLRAHLPWAATLMAAPATVAALPPFATEDELGLWVCVDQAAAVAPLAQAGVRHFQFSAAEAGTPAWAAEAARAVAAARQCGVRLLVHGPWQQALALGADGLHLNAGEWLDDIDWAQLQAAGMRLSLGVRGLCDLACAAALQPSVLQFGPVHAEPGTPSPGRALGAHNLAFACGLMRDLPVLAGGPFSAERARHAARCGAAGLVVGIEGHATGDPAERVALYQRAWSEGRRLLPLAMPELPQAVA